MRHSRRIETARRGAAGAEGLSGGAADWVSWRPLWPGLGERRGRISAGAAQLRDTVLRGPPLR